MKNLVDFKVVLSVESVEKWLKGSMEITAYKVSIDPSSKKCIKKIVVHMLNEPLLAE